MIMKNKWQKLILKICLWIAVAFVVATAILCLISAPRGKTDPTEMTFYEYGVQNEKTVVLIHPSVVYSDFFEYVVPLLQDDFHVIVPAMPGYDKTKPQSNYTSVEQIAAGIEQWLLERAEKNGFLLREDEFDVVHTQWYSFQKGKGRAMLFSATYEGALTVLNKDLFVNALTAGIGRGKAYGMGLMTVVH